MKIGKIDIENPLLLAPMEDVTDLPFRLICKKLGADIVYTEFVNSEGLIRDSYKTIKKMDFWDEERPIGIQIYGGNPDSMESAARMAESMNPDLIDINCGCWVKNVVKNGAGSDLLRDLPRMEQIIRKVVDTVKLPVTVKTRLGWDADTIQIVDVAKMVEHSGASGLTIHCRTRAQAHKGEPDFSWIQKVKSAVSIPIIVNGSLSTPQGIKEIFQATECDGVMIGRAAIDNPWIFKQSKHYLETGEFDVPPSLADRFDLIQQHLHLSIQIKGERKGVIEFRKHYSGYLKGLYEASKVRQKLMLYTDLEPIITILNDYKNKLVQFNVTQHETTHIE